MTLAEPGLTPKPGGPSRVNIGIEASADGAVREADQHQRPSEIRLLGEPRPSSAAVVVTPSVILVEVEVEVLKC